MNRPRDQGTSAPAPKVPHIVGGDRYIREPSGTSESLASRLALLDTPRVRYRLSATAVVVLLTACSGGHGFTAEILPTPFAGTVLTAHADHGKCLRAGCPFDYRISITNPTDRDANVQVCRLVETPRLRLPVMHVAGLSIRAHATRTWKAYSILPIEKKAAQELAGRRLSCTGLDWHGHPPI